MSLREFVIKVPCTSSNIGPGFDVLGLSLSLYLKLHVSVDPSKTGQREPVLSYAGQGAKEAPLNPYQNLITRVALYVLRVNKIAQFPAGVTIHVDNDIPFGRGLGSSGAAVVAGIFLGNALGQLDIPRARLLDYALMIERHPDNVTAALVGGFVGSYLRELSPKDTATTQVPLSEVLPEYPHNASASWGTEPPVPPFGIGHFIRYGWAPEIKVIAIVPHFEVLTAEARSVLPKQYASQDVVFNLQRLSVLTAALARSPPDANLIYQAMQDKIHQPYRKHLIPGLARILASVMPTSHPGLLGICLSGAGPTILALATQDMEQIADTICAEFAKEDITCDVKFLDVTQDGATVEE
ncbi:homoserine kinase [Malassezia vespertilionis]|uniref:Homoserine kinase n=1 Tax=Malassezia vespertilionis TaxID=2020962 RepID=A0A2N1JB69_9BASI|nr:homoserine kinase [Malassezia vespertilionis]PKI83801.1 hypothetical protein MVES_002171 [Malassezia vespertilionis]WFD06949.1 homoserine kinase [Malassezia vespertilionis]